MGRRYTAELQELDATYAWAIRASVVELTESVALSAHHPLISVGSGGSLTSAHFAELLHGCFTGQAAQTLTPYELITTPRYLGDTAILLCSAGGSNPDVISAAQQVLKRSPFHLFAITTKLVSPLKKRLEAANWPRCHAFAIPTRKDGFLATNSLLASLVLLIRAYESWAGLPSCLPETLDQLLHPGATRGDFVEHLHCHLGPVLDRSTLVVLYGAETKPAALDIESRFTEAALAAVQPADFRNFAHGRHHWLAKHGETSGVLAFCKEGDEIAQRTLALLPRTIPRWQVTVEPGIRGALAAVCQSLLLAHIAGTAKGIDPGRPQVPTFGRQLYHLKAMPTLYPHTNEAHERMNLAIERKSRCPVTSLEIRRQIDIWTGCYRHFIDQLAKAQIRCVVMDYDGTLCAPQRRFDGLSSSIAKQINHLLTEGVTIAIATGRGESVREVLLRHITAPENQSRLIIGYHNGAEIALLSDTSTPPGEQPLALSLVGIAKAMQASNLIVQNADIVAKGKQISLKFRPAADRVAICHEAVRVFQPHQTCGATLVTSSHSIDIIAPGVNKANVVDYVVRRLNLPNGGVDTVLCIGDRGHSPGNDADLLTHPLSLSVDEVNEDPSTCWSIAKPGLRFDLACLEYLTRLKPGKTGMRFDMTGVRL
mgnify:CR=1 FL=1